ncbi:MAG: isochorismate synthase [Armatimonadetes bacterium]|nr:isochorismate synthase [Armatimonadota bacterium]
MQRPSAKEHSLVDLAASAVGRLLRKTEVAARRARLLDRPVLAWTATRIPWHDPIDTFGHFTLASADRLLWSHPDERCSVLGIGSAWSVTAEGAERFRRVDAAWQEVLAEAVGDDDGPDDWWAGPVAMAGFSFQAEGPSHPRWSGFPAGLIVLPRLCLVSTGDVSSLIFAVVLGPDRQDLSDAEREVTGYLRLLTAAPSTRVDDSGGESGGTDLQIEEFPSAADWKAAVGAAAQAIRAGALEKVVLARGLRVCAAEADPGRMLQRLRAGYPHCTLFAFDRDEQCFLGATPERLVRLRDREVSVMALAGSAPRGSTLEEDRHFGERLQASAKDRIEHAVVVDALRAALAEVAPTVLVSPAPELLKLQNVQHLCTALAVKLRERRTVLELVGRLHPTPAVGGMPRDAALRWIRRREGMDRGWYAAPVGWVNRRGEGEFAVAIRSALLDDDAALLFAGCGIVADSDPDQEYAESWLKLRPMLSALREAKG